MKQQPRRQLEAGAFLSLREMTPPSCRPATETDFTALLTTTQPFSLGTGSSGSVAARFKRVILQDGQQASSAPQKVLEYLV